MSFLRQFQMAGLLSERIVGMDGKPVSDDLPRVNKDMPQSNKTIADLPNNTAAPGEAPQYDKDSKEDAEKDETEPEQDDEDPSQKADEQPANDRMMQSVLLSAQACHAALAAVVEYCKKDKGVPYGEDKKRKLAEICEQMDEMKVELAELASQEKV